MGKTEVNDGVPWLESFENAKLLTFKQNESNCTLTKTSGALKKGESKFVKTYKMKCYMCQQSHTINKCTYCISGT